MKLLIALTFTLIAMQAHAQSVIHDPKYYIGCEVERAGVSEKSNTVIRFEQHPYVYGQYYRVHDFITAQTSSSNLPKLKFKSIVGKEIETLSAADVVTFGFDSGNFQTASFGELLQGVTKQFHVDGQTISTVCLARQ